VIMDCAPHDRVLGAACALASLVLIPCTPSGLDLEAAAQTPLCVTGVAQISKSSWCPIGWIRGHWKGGSWSQGDDEFQRACRPPSVRARALSGPSRQGVRFTISIHAEWPPAKLLRIVIFSSRSKGKSPDPRLEGWPLKPAIKVLFGPIQAWLSSFNYLGK
jgi:hypothetical protein